MDIQCYNVIKDMSGVVQKQVLFNGILQGVENRLKKYQHTVILQNFIGKVNKKNAQA